MKSSGVVARVFAFGRPAVGTAAHTTAEETYTVENPRDSGTREPRIRALAGWRVALLLACLAAATPARAQIRYSVSLARRVEHQFGVTMTVPKVRGRLVVAMPAWNATYDIRDFAARVQDIRASTAGPAVATVPVRAVDQQTWEMNATGAVRMEYSVYWNDPGPFNSQLNSHHAFVNFAEILLYAPGRRHEPVEVEFTDVPPGWKVAVELPAGACGSCYAAGGYDALVDAPAEIGTFSEFRFEAGDARYRVAVDGAGWDESTLEGWLKKIVTCETGMMREAPFSEYLFLYHIGPGNGGGGMEHANSTAIAVGTAAAIPSVTTHEFFHLWNVKRIRPQSLEPVDYSRPMWTPALWFAEGVTSTYGSYTLVRSGLWTPEQYLQHLGDLITALESRPARAWQSVEESSLDTWLDRDPYYGRPNRSISYYNKGELDGILLDVMIRAQTVNRASLDDVLRYLNDAYAHRHLFYDDGAGIEAAVEHVAGRSFADFFRRYVAGADEVPWAEMLAPAGLAVKSMEVQVADPGFEWSFAVSGEAEVAEVRSGGPAEKAGLEEGDSILSAGGELLPRTAQTWARRHQPGDAVALRIERGGEARTLSLTFGAVSRTAYRVEPVASPTPRQRSILNGILRGTTD